MNDKFVSRERDFTLRLPRNDERLPAGEGPADGRSDLTLPDIKKGATRAE